MFFFLLMIRRPPRSTLDRSSAASDVYKRQPEDGTGRKMMKGKNTQSKSGGNKYGPGNGTGNNGVGPQDGTGSVSYTHLRAHETVLDLVCRLLLDKKKKQNTKTQRKLRNK